jgi:hypothetical protein
LCASPARDPRRGIGDETVAQREGSFMPTEIDLIRRKFTAMGSECRFREMVPNRWLPPDRVRAFTLDVVSGGDRQHFLLVVDPEKVTRMAVLNCHPRGRHLVLMLRERDPAEGDGTHRFLCGHDEREWFAAAVPETARVTTVVQAKEALKPGLVREAQQRRGVKTKHRQRRRNDAFVRQGEWFFVPAPDLEVDPALVLRHEPLSRGNGKPHFADFLHRRGGTTVHVHRRWAPQGITTTEKAALVRRAPNKAKGGWRIMRRNPRAFVKGRIRHPDHATVVLNGWHRALPNTESRAPARQNLVFLD